MRGLLALPLILASCLTAPSDRTFVASENLDEVELLDTFADATPAHVRAGALDTTILLFFFPSFLFFLRNHRHESRGDIHKIWLVYRRLEKIVSVVLLW